MATVVKEQTLIIDSSKADSGVPYDCTITLPSRAVQCKEHEQLRIRVQSFVCWNSFESVNDSNNIIRFVRDSDNTITDITIPHGNYTLYELADKIHELFPAVTVEFLRTTNHFRFTFPEDYWISSVNDSWKLIGFDDGSHFGTVIESQYAIELEPVKSIVMELDGVNTTGYMNLDNSSGEMKNSSVLMQIPIECDYPYVPIVYQPADGVNVYVLDKEIQWLRFRMRTMEGDLITSMPTWYATLCIETLDESSGHRVVQTLDAILEFARLDFLRKMLPRGA